MAVLERPLIDFGMAEIGLLLRQLRRRAVNGVLEIAMLPGRAIEYRLVIAGKEPPFAAVIGDAVGREAALEKRPRLRRIVWRHAPRLLAEGAPYRNRHLYPAAGGFRPRFIL